MLKQRCVFLCIVFAFIFILAGCKKNKELLQSEISNTEDPFDKIPTSIMIDEREFSVEEVKTGIQKTFNTTLYYAGDNEDSENIFFNKKMILNKKIEYELYYLPDTDFMGYAQIWFVTPNLEHPLSKPGDIRVYWASIKISEKGMMTYFYSGYHIDKSSYKLWVEEKEHIYLGTHSMCIENIVEPVYEEKSDEWKTRVKKAIQLYMDENNFYSEKSKNLKPGKYHVYVKNFTEADVDSRIIFEHEDGAIYEGFYYFVNTVSGKGPADLNHVEILSEESKESMKSYLEKVKENAAICVEYEVK